MPPVREGPFWNAWLEYEGTPVTDRRAEPGLVYDFVLDLAGYDYGIGFRGALAATAGGELAREIEKARLSGKTWLEIVLRPVFVGIRTPTAQPVEQVLVINLDRINGTAEAEALRLFSRAV